MEQAGASTVLAITAEPGGEEALLKRLADKGVVLKNLQIQSDPNHLTLKNPNVPANIFTLAPFDIPEPYTVIQPALLVYDEDEVAISEICWSWNTKFEKPPSDVNLVVWRPAMRDLVEAIQQRRTVKLASAFSP